MRRCAIPSATRAVVSGVNGAVSMARLVWQSAVWFTGIAPRTVPSLAKNVVDCAQAIAWSRS